jgi:quinol monooxygenase YgiN
MIILAGTIRIGGGRRAAALEPMVKMVEATRAEPGCIEYAFAFDLLDDHVVRIFEVFVDDAAVAAHRASPHMAAWRAAMLGLGVSERNMSSYQVQNRQKV